MTPHLLISLLAASSVSKVVLYPDRAQVTRVTSVACGTRVSARFDGVPPAADPSSFRAQSTHATVEGLKAEARSRREVYGPQVKALDEELEKKDFALQALRAALERADLQARAGGRFSEVAVALVGREMSEPSPNPKTWGQALDVTLQARLKAVATSAQLAAQVRELERQLEDGRRKRGQLDAAAGRHEYFVEVLVSCNGGNADVELSYLVGGASWEPAYEARADEGAQAVDLSAYATVKQSTGEPWTQARVTLSTAIPLQNATPPELQPLKVWAQEREEQKKVLVRRDEYREHAEASGSTVSGSSAGHLRVAEQGLSVQLTVPEPADVPGDATPARLFVGKSRLQAKFANRTLPKLMPFVFRVADVTNTAPFPLLPGPLDAFRRTGLVGHHALERVAQGAPFHLTFGIEDTLRVKRTIVEEVQRDAGLFGGTRRFKYDYKLELANYGSKPQEVELTEHVPVSELDDVKVQVDAKTTGGYELKGDDGMVTWRPTLKPADKREYELAFHVDVPSSYE